MKAVALAHDSHKLSYTGRSVSGHGGRKWQLYFTRGRPFNQTQRKEWWGSPR